MNVRDKVINLLIDSGGGVHIVEDKTHDEVETLVMTGGYRVSMPLTDSQQNLLKPPRPLVDVAVDLAFAWPDAPANIGWLIRQLAQYRRLDENRAINSYEVDGHECVVMILNAIKRMSGPRSSLPFKVSNGLHAELEYLAARFPIDKNRVTMLENVALKDELAPKGLL